MSALTMRRLRESAGLRQTDMAKLMGLSLRGYQELEEEKAAFAPRHLAVLERVSLRLAVLQEDPKLALPVVLQQALDLAKLVGNID